MQQAVFCSDLYFLLPPEYPDFESFRAAVDAAVKPFEVKALTVGWRKAFAWPPSS